MPLRWQGERCADRAVGIVSVALERQLQVPSPNQDKRSRQLQPWRWLQAHQSYGQLLKSPIQSMGARKAKSAPGRPRTALARQLQAGLLGQASPLVQPLPR